MKPVAIAYAVLLAVATERTLGDELGRLFFDVKQRVALDEKRKKQNTKGITTSIASGDIEASNEELETQSVPLPTPRITGKVVRSSGNNTVWINQYPHYKKSASP